MNSTKSDWFFIVNPHAGSGKTMCKWVPIEQRLIKHGIQFDTAYTDYKRHATTLAYEAANDGYRYIFAVGGDGSLHETLRGIMKWCDETGTNPSEFKTGVIPIGSGNDWLKSVTLPPDTEDVVNMLLRNSFSQMDVVKVRSIAGKVSYMANVGGVGFDSHVCKRVNIQKEAGHRNKMIYFNALRYTILNLGYIKVQVIADGNEIFQGKCLSIAMGNGQYSGGGMRQVPGADPDDGLLDVMICPMHSVWNLFFQCPKLFTGKIKEVDSLIFARCKELQIIPLDSMSNDIIEVDGEIAGRLPLTAGPTGQKIGILAGPEYIASH